MGAMSSGLPMLPWTRARGSAGHEARSMQTLHGYESGISGIPRIFRPASSRRAPRRRGWKSSSPPLAPSLTSPLDIAAPIPFEAPVTMATFPLSFWLFSDLFQQAKQQAPCIDGREFYRLVGKEIPPAKEPVPPLPEPPQVKA
jgi:hypothetical protein